MRTRVAVVPPGAAEAGALLEDHEVVPAGPFERDGHAQAGHAGAQDHDLVLRHATIVPDGVAAAVGVGLRANIGLAWSLHSSRTAPGPSPHPRAKGAP